jgi:hypothetical protein
LFGGINFGWTIEANERSIVHGFLFITFTLTCNYQINVHQDKDNDDICFILWLWKGKFLFVGKCILWCLFFCHNVKFLTFWLHDFF